MTKHSRLARTIIACCAAMAAAGLAASAQRARTIPAWPSPPPPSSITAGDRQAQLARALERSARAFAIVERLGADAKARGLHPGWRQSMLEALLPLGDERLRRIERDAGSLDEVTANLAADADDPTDLGSYNADLTFTPVTPCRYIDTRNAGGKISGVRGFRIDQTGAPYGGLGACDLLARFGIAQASPSALAALAINVTVVDTSAAGAPGFLAVKPKANSPTTSLLNWHDAGPGVQVANQAVVALEQLGVPHFVVETSGAVHVIVDVFGGFLAPSATALETVTVSTPLAPVQPQKDLDFTTTPCPAGFSLVGGGCITDHRDHVLGKSLPSGQAWRCATQNNTANISFVGATAVCARIPGR